MTDLAPGQPITIHAVVEQVCARGDVCARVSNGLLFVPPDAIAPAPRLFRYTAAQVDHPMTYLAEHGDWLWLLRSDAPVMARRAWVEEIPAADPARE